MTDAHWLLVAAASGILLRLVLVMWLRLHAFVSLLLVSLVVAVVAGMPLSEIVDNLEKGMGSTLGFVATVVGLGAMFGRMLEISGGVDRLAHTLIARFGPERVPWAMSITGFLVAIPVFLDVGFIILVPLVYALSQRANRSLLYYGIPLLAGLGVTHTFIPPTPGPIAVASLIHADLGWVIIFGVLCGMPAAIIAGPLFGRYIAKRIDVRVPEAMSVEPPREDVTDLPSFKMIASIILLPLVLILFNTMSGVLLANDNPLRSILDFLGDPIVALLITTLVAFYVLGTCRGLTREQILSTATKSLEPAGVIILVTGAGGAFKQMLIASGVGDVVGHAMAASSLSPLLLAFLIATGVRVIQGSATVAMITAAGLMAPVIASLDLQGPMLGLMTVAIASGATVLSHVNDSGFWLVKQYFGMTEKQTLMSWTVVETLIGLIGIAMAMLLSLFVI